MSLNHLITWDESGKLTRTMNFLSKSPLWENLSNLFPLGEKVNDIALDWYSEYIASDFVDGGMGAYVVTTTGTNLKIYYIDDTRAVLPLATLKATYTMSDSSVTTTARIAVSRTVAGFVAVHWCERTGCYVGRSTDGGTTWGSAVLIGAAFTGDERNDNAECGFVVEGEHQLCSGHDGTNYKLYLATTKTGNFLEVAGSPVSITPFCAITSDMQGNAYVSLPSVSGTISPSPYTDNFGTGLGANTLPVSSNHPFGFQNPTLSEMSSFQSTGGRGGASDGCIAGVNVDPEGHEDYEAAIIVDLGAPTTVTSASYYIRTETNSPWCGWRIHFWREDKTQIWGGPADALWGPATWNLKSWSGSKENCRYVSFHYYRAHQGDDIDIPYIDDISVAFTVYPTQNGSLWRVDSYVSSPTWIAITPGTNHSPRYPSSIGINSTNKNNVIVIATNAVDTRLYESSDQGNTWIDKGIVTYAGISVSDTNLILSGLGCINFSVNDGTTIENKTGNLVSILGSTSRVRGILDNFWSIESLDACIHEGCSCPGNHACKEEYTQHQVGLYTGEKREDVTDLTLNTPAGPLAFTRTYRQSKLTDTNYDFMGLGWTHNHHIRLSEDMITSPHAIIVRLGNSEIRFKKTSIDPAPIHYEAEAGSTAFIDVDPGSTSARYTLTTADKSIFVFEVYDTNKGRLRSRIWPTGEVWTYNYDGSGKLLDVVDDAYDLGSGVKRQFTFSYYTVSPDTDKLKRVTDHTGRYVEFAYTADSSGTNRLLATVTDVRGKVWTYNYHLSQQNFLSQYISPAVDTDGDGTPNGTLTLKDLTYTLSGSTLIGLTEKLGGTTTPLLQTTFAFQPSGKNITTEETPSGSGKITTHRFAKGVYVGPKDPAGNYGFRLVNKQYRPKLQIDPNGNETRLKWSANGKHLDQVADPFDKKTTFNYNANDTLNYSLDAEGRKTEYTYGDVDNPRLPTWVKVFDTNGTTVLRWQEFTYDAKGRVLTEKTLDPANGTTLLQQVTRAYHPSGNGNGLLHVVTQKDIGGSNDVVTTYSYDNVGRVIKTQQSSNFGQCDISFTVYDAAGNVVATICNYDPGLNPDPTTAAEAVALYNSAFPDKNQVTTYAYDEMGRRVKTTINDGAAFKQTTLTFYDALNRVWRTISNYVNQSGGVPEPPALWVWSATNGRWEKSASDPTPISHGADNNQNLIRDIVYNTRGLVESQRDVAGRVTHLIYDDAGQVARTISNYVPQGDPATDPTAWVWDEADKRWEYGADLPVDHDNNDQNLITEQMYDAAGNLVKTIDPQRNVTLTGYDALNRPKKTIRNASQPDYDILADPDLSEYVSGTAADQDLVDETDYDAMGRVVRTRQLVDKQLTGEQWDTTLYGYDSLGRQVKVVRAASDPEYVFDHAEDDPALSLYTGYAENLSVPDQDIVSTTEYDPAGRVLSTEDALHRKTRFVYDGFGRQVRTISNYVPQGSSDPAAWVWGATDGRWERSSTDNTAIEHGSDNDQNLIQETFYDSDGRVLETRDVLGRLTRNVYDASHHLKFTIVNYVAQTADPSAWVWASNRWEDGSGNPIAHGTANDQNSMTEMLYDVHGRVEATRDALGRISRNVYDDLGRVIRAVTNYVDQGEDPKLWVWNNGWKQSDGTTPISHGADNDQNIISSIIYDAQGRVLQTIDHRNNVTLYVYDRLGRQVKTIASYVPQGSTDPADWMWSATNHRWEDGSGNAISFGTDNDQNRITATIYDLAGRVVSTRDAAGIETRFEYDALGRRVTTITNYVDGIYSASAPDEDLISTTSYNKGGQVLATTDARNTQTAFAYDQAGRRLTVTQAAGSSLASTAYTCYDKAGRVLRTIANWTDDPTQPAPDAKDGSGNWQFVPQHNGAYNDRDLVTLYDYDLASRRTQVTDPMGNATATAYFKNGQVQSITDPENVVTQCRYDGLRRRTRVVQGYVVQGSSDPHEWTWDATDDRWEYPTNNPVAHGTNNDQNIIVDVNYDKAGRVLSQRDPRGNVTTYQYDQLDRRKSLTNPISKTWSTAYADLTDGKTRVTMTYPGITGANNYPVQRDYDRLGRLASIQYGGPATTPDVKFTYDGAGNRSKMSEYSGADFTNRICETSYGFDAVRRLTTVGFDNDGDGATDETVSYEYDAGGLRTKLTLPGNLNVTYTYDQRGQLVSLTDWDSQPTQFAYDLAGRHIATERANGLRSRYQHDAAGRLRLLRHHASSEVFAQYEYQLDKRGNCTQAREVFQNPMAVPPITINFDDKGIVLRGTWTSADGFRETTDFGASLSLMFLGENRKDQNGILGDNLVLTVGTGPDHSIFDVYIGGSLWQSFDGYAAAAGQLDIKLEVHGEGPHLLELRNRAEKHSISSGYKLRFKHLIVANNAWMTQTIGYSYDALSRLLEARYAPGLNTEAATADLLRHYLFTYDRAGNRLSESVAIDGGEPIVNTYSYDAANRISNPGYAYDHNGNLIGYGSTTYTWDRANRMVARGSLTYQYDGVGNRIMDGTLKYLFDVQPGLAVALAQTDTRYTVQNTIRYLHGPRGIHAEENEYGDWNWMLQDKLGSVRGRVNNFMTLYEVDMYAPYGQQIMGGLIPNRYGFTGEPMDSNGLLYLRARYYSPNLGVFTSLDPFEGFANLPLSVNRYGYVRGNPVNYADPLGLNPPAPPAPVVDISPVDAVRLAEEYLASLERIGKAGAECAAAAAVIPFDGPVGEGACISGTTIAVAGASLVFGLYFLFLLDSQQERHTVTEHEVLANYYAPSETPNPNLTVAPTGSTGPAVATAIATACPNPPMPTGSQMPGKIYRAEYKDKFGFDWTWRPRGLDKRGGMSFFNNIQRLRTILSGASNVYSIMRSQLSPAVWLVTDDGGTGDLPEGHVSVRRSSDTEWNDWHAYYNKGYPGNSQHEKTGIEYSFTLELKNLAAYEGQISP